MSFSLVLMQTIVLEVRNEDGSWPRKQGIIYTVYKHTVIIITAYEIHTHRLHTWLYVVENGPISNQCIFNAIVCFIL